jgi:hypothetical protein
MDELELLAARLDQLAVDPQATMHYDLFAGGVVWSDERPAWEVVVENGVPTIVGQGSFRALLNQRHSLILGDAGKRFQHLWEKAQQLCPNWPGFLPSRQDPALAGEARAKREASNRSFEELFDDVGEGCQQQQARVSTTSA